MTAAASQRLPICPRWGQFLRICPIWPTLCTRPSDMSIVGTYFRDVSISTSFLDACRLAAPCEQADQAARLDQLIWASLEDIGYGR